MKLCLSLLIGVFGLSLLQYGCGNANNSSQSVANNQNLTSVPATLTPSPTTTPSANQAATNNGASEEEARPFIELMERCKHAPVGKAKVTPLTGTAPLTVTFDGSPSYDPDGTKIVKWEWHFGNGQSAEGKAVTYIYDKPGKYGIILNVTDSQGQKTFDCSDGGTDINIVVTDGKTKSEK
jgi:PKD repeat protein